MPDGVESFSYVQREICKKNNWTVISEKKKTSNNHAGVLFCVFWKFDNILQYERGARTVWRQIVEGRILCIFYRLRNKNPELLLHGLRITVFLA